MELRAHGCSSVQGFLFAEPMSSGDVELLFSEGSDALQNVA
jgi:EAL domain-containing protein (putative c-di-GMP-specific phosphodiesterase class I)